MTRPRKDIVDYFPHYITRGKTIPILEKKFGNNGYAFWWKILEILGMSEGHYFDCNNPANWEFLSTYTLVTEDIAYSILDLLAKIDAIDKNLWVKKIIWSENFVANLTPLYSRRKQKPPTREIIVNINTLSSELLRTETPLAGVNDDINPHSKVKDSKVLNTCASEMHERGSKKLKANDFSEFWIVYPKKKAKGDAEKAWAKAKKSLEFNLERIISAVNIQKQSQDWQKDGGQFIPLPATWLNGKRWLDEDAQAQMDDYDAYMDSLIDRNGSHQ